MSTNKNSRGQIRIKLSTRFPDWSFARQTPGSKGVWNDCDFYIDDNTDECDWWIIFGGINKKETVRCNPKNIILLTDEPSQVKHYDNKFVGQFNTVITVQKSIDAPRIIYEQLLPWYVGAHYDKDKKRFDRFDKSYDELKQIKDIQKTRLVSVICSSKDGTPGHRQRIRFVKKLKKYFGDQLDVFGFGSNTIEDKWNAIYPYKYHIVLENSVEENYWTEKLADAYLAESYPIYYGCPNIHAYFRPDQISCILTKNINEDIKIIEKIIKERSFEKSRPQIYEAKKMILDHYQMFSRLCEIIHKLEKENNNYDARTPVTIFPEIIVPESLLDRQIGKVGFLFKSCFPKSYVKLKSVFSKIISAYEMIT